MHMHQFPLQRTPTHDVQRDTLVQVEVQSHRELSFGRGQTERMPVSDFFRRLKNGADRVYLSTQDADVDFDGHPKLLTPPLAQLPGLPIRPRIMGELVPHAINLWLGASVDGTSSGLHPRLSRQSVCAARGHKALPPVAAKRCAAYVHTRCSGACACERSVRSLQLLACVQTTEASVQLLHSAQMLPDVERRCLHSCVNVHITLILLTYMNRHLQDCVRWGRACECRRLGRGRRSRLGAQAQSRRGCACDAERNR